MRWRGHAYAGSLTRHAATQRPPPAPGGYSRALAVSAGRRSGSCSACPLRIRANIGVTVCVAALVAITRGVTRSGTSTLVHASLVALLVFAWLATFLNAAVATPTIISRHANTSVERDHVSRNIPKLSRPRGYCFTSRYTRPVDESMYNSPALSTPNDVTLPTLPMVQSR